MNSNPIKIPGPDHPITITRTKGRVTVTVNGKRVADTHEALTLKEATLFRRIGNPGIPGVLPGPGRRHRSRAERAAYADSSRVVMEYLKESASRQSRRPSAVSPCGYIRKPSLSFFVAFGRATS